MAEGELSSQDGADESVPRTVSADDIPRLLALWHSEARRRGITALVKSGVVMGAAAALAVVLSRLLTGPAVTLPWAGFLAGMIGLLLALSYACSEPTQARSLTPRQREVLADLEAIDDVRAVEPLLVALSTIVYYPAGLLATSIATALVRLLPRMGADQAAVVASIRTRLYRYITPQAASQLPDLVIAILRLLRNETHLEALARVAFLIVQDAPTKTQQHVRDEARLCFPDLLASADFGGPAGLAHWIERLPSQTVASMDWDQFILPQLALKQNLPHLSVEEFLALDVTVRQRLYRSLLGLGYDYSHLNGELSRLGPGYGPDLLDLAARARDREAVSTVRALVYDDTRASRRVREAAREHLPVFEAVARQERVGRTLLRASSAPTDPEHSLLRPAADAAPTDPHELLRAEGAGGFQTDSQAQNEPVQQSLKLGRDARKP
jgi:hypothetical protein